MSVADAAAALDVNPRQVRNLIDAGALDAQRVGRAWVVDAASVRARSARPVAPGRPLSPGRAWQVLAVVDAGLRPNLGVPEDVLDRRVRHELRRLLSGRTELESWAQWLRNRAEHRRVWFHPAAADPRVVHVDLGALLDVRAADLTRFYVADADVAGVVADHRGRVLGPGDDSADTLDLMVVPANATSWRAHVPAAAIVDLTSHPDARVRQAALDRLGAALDAALPVLDGGRR